MRNDSVQYAQQVFDHMGLYVQNVMNNIQAAKEGLKNIEVKKEEQPSSEEK